MASAAAQFLATFLRAAASYAATEDEWPLSSADTKADRYAIAADGWCSHSGGHIALHIDASVRALAVSYSQIGQTYDARHTFKSLAKLVELARASLFLLLGPSDARVGLVAYSMGVPILLLALRSLPESCGAFTGRVTAAAFVAPAMFGCGELRDVWVQDQDFLAAQIERVNRSLAEKGLTTFINPRMPPVLDRLRFPNLDAQAACRELESLLGTSTIIITPGDGIADFDPAAGFKPLATIEIEPPREPRGLRRHFALHDHPQVVALLNQRMRAI